MAYLLVIYTVPFRKYPGCIKEGAGCMQTTLHMVKIAGRLRNLVGQNTPPYAE